MRGTRRGWWKGPGRGHAGGRARRLAAASGAVLVLGLVVTVLFSVQPGRGPSLYAPQLRSLMEVVGAGIVGFAALVLAVPDENDVRPARNAFATALLVLAVTNGVAGLLHLTTDRVVSGLALYPWVAARYVAAAFFVMAGMERPRIGLGRYLVLGLGVLGVTQLAVVTVGGGLPAPVELLPGTSEVVVSSPGGHVLLQAPVVVLFGLGGWLAGRTYVLGAASEYAWLSMALTVQALAQVHEILFPTLLGPVLGSADVLRLVSFTVLCGGALVQIRRLYRHRSEAVAQQDRDLRAQRALNLRLLAVAEQEADFRTLVTHELATPLAAIRAFGHAARRRADGLDDERLRATLEGIEAEARRVQELVGRMEELRHLETDDLRLELRPVLVRPLLEEAGGFVQGLPGAHPVTVDADHDRVVADPVRLGQALRNMVGNAARYAPPGTPIAIRGRTDGSRYRITVDDAGPGIPVGERQRVLHRYSRGSRAGVVPGQGLGLYLAARIVAGHHGSLGLHDAPGGGTRVVILLPVAPASGRDRPGSPEDTPVPPIR